MQKLLCVIIGIRQNVGDTVSDLIGKAYKQGWRRDQRKRDAHGGAESTSASPIYLDFRTIEDALQHLEPSLHYSCDWEWVVSVLGGKTISYHQSLTL